MDDTAKHLCEQIQGAQFAYTQSDEISILLTDFAKPTTSAWFDGNIQKMASVSASLATAFFNIRRYGRGHITDNLPTFDSRVFVIPDRTEVANYFIWRNNDAARNSINMVGQSLFSHKELQGKGCNEVQEMIFQKGINWSEYDQNLKNGRLIVKETYIAPDSTDDSVKRTRWKIEPAWVFTKDQESLYKLIPQCI
jgi:tRNA(His) 5'-end guanylyltransferase